MQKQLPDFNELKKGADILNALDHPLRMQILKFIHKKRAATVTEIFIATRTEQSVASSQLRILREADLVTTKRKGKYIYYSVSLSRIDKVNGLISSFLKGSNKNYMQKLSDFAKDSVSVIEMEPLEFSPEGIDNWLKCMETELKTYHNNLMKKAEELTSAAEKNGDVGINFSKAEITKIGSEGLKLAFKRYGS